MNKHGMKRFLSAMLSVCLFLSLLMPVTAKAEVTDETTPDIVVDETAPVATEPEVTEPEATEPEVTEPEATEPEATEPEVTEPEVTEPESSAKVTPGEPFVDNYADFIKNLKILEGYAKNFAATSAKDEGELVINFIRTGVDRYNESLWPQLAGQEIVAFTNYVKQQDAAKGTNVMAMRNIKNFKLVNGNKVDFGHMFGTLNIAYISVQASADLGGWAGDICDLMYFSAFRGNVPEGTVEEMAAFIKENCFGVDASNAFGMNDFYGDMDAFYLINQVKAGKKLSAVMEEYFTEDLTDSDRAAYFMNNRFKGLKTREDVRNAVYTAYTGNVGLRVLEADREISHLNDLRTASCYAFADYIFELGGDRLEGDIGDPEDPDQPDNPDEPEDSEENTGFKVFSSTKSTPAPGVTQEIKYALNQQGKQVVYYVGTLDVSRSDLHVFANYKDNDPTKGWGMQRVTDQIEAAKQKHTNPDDSKYYMENYTPVIGVNADFYNMSNGKPSGALVMEGVTYNGANGSNFFAILKDGTPIIASGSEWNTYASQVKEAVGGSSIVLRNGEVTVDDSSRAPRTGVGITASGKVVLVVLDGRQEPFSAGATMADVGRVLADAGCVVGMNLDGGGSSTFASKPEGSDTIRVINSPSDGYARSVSSSILVVSTAAVSNEFEYASVTSDYEYMTPNTELQMHAVGVSVSGSAADIPENAVWKVSNDEIAEISEDGVLLALDYGVVEAQLVVGDKIVGKKTMIITLPDEVAFQEDSLNAIYGEETELPVSCFYSGNPIAFNLDDIYIYPTDENAGYSDGLYFIGDEEYGMRAVEVNVELNEDTTIRDTMIVKLFKADEAVFDFDKASAGDRILAWNRVVSNATTADGITYQVTDPEQGMDVEYTFALDMTSISIPEKLAGLVYMLPGGDQVDATAWDFLMQLAERVSVLSEVKVVAKFDEDMEVDVSGLKVMNDYFYMKKVELDETTNTVTLTCGWVDQTQAIDPKIANPICILSGIKVQPKAGAAWDSNNQLDVLLSGDVSYNIFLRANALYNFAVIPENQQTYGLVPFVNEDVIINGAPERGASFSDTYTQFQDHFILDKTDRQGWVKIENHLYYFVDNAPISAGIHLLPSYEDASKKLFYSFSEDGSSMGVVNGLFQLEDGMHFAIEGEPKVGWQTISVDGEAKYYFFDRKTGVAVDGQQKIDGYNYTFTDYILTRGEIVKDSRGYRYRWAGDWVTTGWIEIDGEIYHAYTHANGYFDTGMIKRWSPDGEFRYYLFAEDGRWMREFSGFHFVGDKTYWIQQGYVIEFPGLVIYEGDYYYISSKDVLVKNCTYWISKTNGLLPEKSYTFDADGKIVFDTPVTPNPPVEPEPDKPVDPDTPVKNGIVDENGERYYYVNGVKTYAGVVEVDGDYYYVNSSCMLVRNRKYWITKTNGLLPEKSYEFDADGKMTIKNGLYEENGGLYLYKMEVWQRDYTGLYTTKSGDTYYIVKGIADLNVGLVRTVLESGEVNYYYFCDNKVCNLETCPHNGTAVKNGVHWVEKNNNLLPSWDYTFDANGVIVHEDTSRNGILPDAEGVDCYYIDGIKAYMGLIKIGEDYYYIRSNGEVAKNTTYWISKTNGIVPEGSYVIDENGKVHFGDVIPGEPDQPTQPDQPEEPVVKDGIVEEHGGLYYYKDGKLFYAGLIKIGDDYYYVNSSCRLITGRKYWITKTNGLLPEKSYTFDETGKIVFDEVVTPDPDIPENPDVPEDPDVPEEPPVVKEGIVAEEDGLYFYKNGKLYYAGLIKIDEDYYYVNTAGKLITGRKYWITKTNGLLPERSYTFDENGKIVFEDGVIPSPDPTPENPGVMKEGIVAENGGLYYYKDGKLFYAGLIQIDEYYYYVNSQCQLITGRTYWITKTNGLLPEASYTFDDQGRIVF